MKRRTLRHAAPRGRWILIAGVALVCASAHVDSRAATDPDVEKYIANGKALVANCELAPVSRRMTGDGYDITSIQTAISWTGGCVKNKRDGRGVLTTRDETRDNLKNVVTLNSITKQDITLVAGEPVGLYCVDSTSYNEGAVYSHTDLGCALAGFPVAGYDFFRKTSDGRWRLLELGKFLEPPVTLAPGALESASERMVAEVRAAKALSPVKLDSRTPALDDIVRDGRFVRLMQLQPLDLKTRRVAIVLTGHALAELDRFRKMRQSLIDQSARGRLKSRAAFIENSDPARLLGGLAAPMRTNAKSVVPADDLTPLTDGSADYVLVIDWNYTGNFALSPKEFQAVAACDDYGPDSQCLLLFAQNTHAWLFDRNLEVVRSYTMGMSYPISSAGIADRKYESLVEKLASGFGFTWRIDIIGAMLTSVLSREP